MLPQPICDSFTLFARTLRRASTSLYQQLWNTYLKKDSGIELLSVHSKLLKIDTAGIA